ncbi:hypothetical protein CUZ89_2504 [Enterococcus xinjiangensis]|uniref:hypothetical protein n=1 Tax=Enterococcus lactis TaxID=357441 RepID=UPI000347848B|nr:hypothetical protein [Enterococcus lactis]MBL5004316.1 hypothetical protein [Enterococcus lactis]MBX9062311.1 hypothetical protein [Enterococcus faecium]
MKAVYHLFFLSKKLRLHLRLRTFFIFVPLLAVPYDFSHKRQGIPTTKATIGKPLSMNNHSMTDTEM